MEIEEEQEPVFTKPTIEGWKKVQRKTSYSKAAARNRELEIVITPNDDTMDSEGTKKLIKESINPVEEGLNIHKITTIGTGAVRIKVQHAEQLDRIKNAIEGKAGDRVRTTINQKFNPKVFLKSVCGEIKKEDLAEVIWKQNAHIRDGYAEDERLFKQEIDVRVLLSARRRNLANAIIEVSPRLRRIMLEKEIGVYWESAVTEDYVGLTQCFKCYKTGHTSTRCRGIEVCKKCGTSGHKKETCREIKPRCGLCTNTNKYTRDDRLKLTKSTWQCGPSALPKYAK